jgi:hypothetical protein
MTRALLRSAAPAVSLAAAAWAVWWSVDRGRRLQQAGPEIKIGAAPLVGRVDLDSWDWRFGFSVLVAAVLAAAVAGLWWSGWFERARLRWIVLASAAGSALFAVMLALVDGVDGLRYGIDHPSEYLATLDQMPPTAEFIDTFLRDINYYSVHVRGHPPGFVVMLQAMRGIGLGGTWPLLTLTVLALAATVVATLVIVHGVAGTTVMRRAAPWLIVAPYLLWMMSSADAIFTAWATGGVALLVRALVATSWRRQVALGALAGTALGWLLFLTYLGATFMVVPVAVGLWGLTQRRTAAVTPLAAATVLIGVVTLVMRRAGFWWFDGVEVTKLQYEFGTAQFRPWGYFRIANLAVAAIAVGPVVIAALGALHNGRVRLLVVAGLMALMASHLSTFTKAEVERIWLPFFPFVTIAAATFLGSRHRAIGAALIVVQAGAALLLQSSLVQKW